MAVGIVFGGNQLQTFDGNHGIIVQEIEHAGKNARSAQMYQMSHGNQSAIPYVEYPNRKITVSGQIVGQTIADCDSIIDTFQSYLLAQNANLDIDYNSGTRRYSKVTVSESDISRPGNLRSANFTITFMALKPFGTDTTPTTLLTAAARTSGSYSDVLTIAGTAPFQTPLITITFGTIGSSPVAGTVTLGNDATGQAITISRIFTTGDVLVIDCSLGTITPVTVNGVPCDFTGAFPDFAPGAGTLDYSDSFASRSFGIAVTYNKNYI